jgi:hypothetical protein
MPSSEGIYLSEDNMQKYSNSVIDNEGRPVNEATVTVTDYPGGGASTIYASDGSNQHPSNTVTTNSLGYFEFYAADGRYSIAISGTGIESRTIDDILLEDPVDANDVTIDNLTVDGNIHQDGGHTDIGNAGLEEAGVNVGGVTYDPKLRVNDIGTSNPAQVVFHRHSTTLQPLLLGARSNSEDNSHSAVTAGQGVFSVLGSGWTGSHYDVFGSIDISASASGTISATSSPGKIVFNTTPDGSNSVAAALTLEQDKSATFTGDVTLPQNDDAVTPTLAFGDGDTGFYEGSDDILRLAVSGALRWQYTSSEFRGNLSASASVLNETASATNPVHTFQGDTDTGIGRASADNISFIAGGAEGARIEDPADLAAGETSLWLYDDDNGTLEQVTVGAADSGGAGYKVLRIPN